MLYLALWTEGKSFDKAVSGDKGTKTPRVRRHTSSTI